MRTTLKDIAKATGVSVATVSLVLNDKPHQIAEATKKMIREKAKEMNYIPNQMARGLVKNKSKNIGFILVDSTDLYISEVARKIQTAAMRTGYHVFFYNADGGEEAEIGFIRTLYESGAMGLIMRSEMYCKSVPIQTLLKQLGMKIVLLEGGERNTNVDKVVLDQRHGSYMMMQHLIEMGHTRIGCITGDLGAYVTTERLAGIDLAIEAYKDQLDEVYFYEGDYQFQSGEAGAHFMLQKDVTAIYAMSDLMAYGVLRVLEEEGLKVPTDMSVVGYDNLPTSEVLPVPLTSVAEAVDELSTAAVIRLVACLEAAEPQEPKTYYCTPNLVIRKSVKDKKKRD